jgi:hypothetical protein
MRTPHGGHKERELGTEVLISRKLFKDKPGSVKI